MSKSPSELRPETLIKRVMSGKKEYRSEEYLQAFGKIPCSDLHVTGSDYSKFEIVKMWNTFQKTPNKCQYFTFSLVEGNHSVIKKIEDIFKHEKYAYILHDKDKSAEHKHYHYVLMFSSPRSFRSVANDLEIPVTMLQKVYSKKGILDYLTHENDPNKHHYELSEIHANFDIEDEKKSDGNGFRVFYEYYSKFRTGLISKDDFVDYINNMYCATLSVYHKMYLAEKVFDTEVVRERRACPVSEFHRQTPEEKLQTQLSFAGIDPNKIVYLEDGTPFSAPLYSGKVRKKRTKIKGNY